VVDELDSHLTISLGKLPDLLGRSEIHIFVKASEAHWARAASIPPPTAPALCHFESNAPSTPSAGFDSEIGWPSVTGFLSAASLCSLLIPRA
jgi:hypothetical protein